MNFYDAYQLLFTLQQEKRSSLGTSSEQISELLMHGLLHEIPRNELRRYAEDTRQNEKAVEGISMLMEETDELLKDSGEGLSRLEDRIHAHLKFFEEPAADALWIRQFSEAFRELGYDTAPEISEGTVNCAQYVISLADKGLEIGREIRLLTNYDGLYKFKKKIVNLPVLLSGYGYDDPKDGKILIENKSEGPVSLMFRYIGAIERIRKKVNSRWRRMFRKGELQNDYEIRLKSLERDNASFIQGNIDLSDELMRTDMLLERYIFERDSSQGGIDAFNRMYDPARLAVLADAVVMLSDDAMQMISLDERVAGKGRMDYSVFADAREIAEKMQAPGS